CWMSSSGAGTAWILSRVWGTVLGLDRFDSPSELLDSALSRVEPRGAEPVELLAALPERDCLVEARVPALESLDDALQLALRLLEGRLNGHRVSSTRAPKPPCPSSTSTGSPAARCVPW